MSWIVQIACLVCILGVWHPAHSVDTSPEEQFREAVALLNDNKFSEAFPLLKTVHAAYPDNPAVLWNLGIAAAELNEDKEALAAWLRYREIDPSNWQVVAKLIQAYQALGQFEERDAKRNVLFELRRAGEDEDLVSAERYCREQFVLNGVKYFAFEYFEPEEEWAVFYAFVAIDDAGYEKYRVSLGSYAGTNEIAWELGDLPRTKRLYHLDRYDGGNHRTLGFYEYLPDYDQIRGVVRDYLGNLDVPE